MLTVKITFDEQKVLRAMQAVGNATRFQSEELPRQMSIHFSTAIRENIASSFYTNRFPPLRPKYAEWKTEVGLGGEPMWKLFGDLITNVKSFRVTEGWMGGIPSGVMDRGGKNWGLKGRAKPIAMYAKVLEEGYRGSGRRPQRPRPLFQYTLQYFAYNQSPILGERALLAVAKEWK